MKIVLKPQQIQEHKSLTLGQFRRREIASFKRFAERGCALLHLNRSPRAYYYRIRYHTHILRSQGFHSDDSVKDLVLPDELYKKANVVQDRDQLGLADEKLAVQEIHDLNDDAVLKVLKMSSADARVLRDCSLEEIANLGAFKLRTSAFIIGSNGTREFISVFKEENEPDKLTRTLAITRDVESVHLDNAPLVQYSTGLGMGGCAVAPLAASKAMLAVLSEEADITNLVPFAISQKVKEDDPGQNVFAFEDIAVMITLEPGFPTIDLLLALRPSIHINNMTKCLGQNGVTGLDTIELKAKSIAGYLRETIDSMSPQLITSLIALGYRLDGRRFLRMADPEY